jgi:PAS domain S-box-containing protein
MHCGQNTMSQSLPNILAHIPDALDKSAIVAVTDAAGVITYVNEMFCDVSGYHQKELIGQTHRLINSAYHSKNFFGEMWSTIGNGHIWKGQIRNRRKNGELYWVATTIVPLLNDAGQPIQYTSIRFDITDQKRVEKEIQQLYTQLEKRVDERTAQLSQTIEQLQKTEKQRERFVAALTHDLRTPLIGQERGLAILSEQRHYLPTAVHPILAQMANSNASLLSMVNRLLDYAHLESGKTPLAFATYSLADILDKTLKQLAPHFEEVCVSPRLHIPEDMPDVMVDKELIERLIGNLLSNSLHHLPANGCGDIAITATYTTTCWQLILQDNGPGIPDEVMPTLFEPYRQGLTRKIGSGLGLSICKMIVERHDGTIEVASSPNNGVCFTLTFPYNTQ